MRSSSFKTLLVLGVPAMLLLSGIGGAAWILFGQDETMAPQEINAELTQSADLVQQPLDVKVASILFEAQRQSPEQEAAGVWTGMIVLRSGGAIPFRIQDVDTTGFTAVGVRCDEGVPCQIGADMDPGLVSQEQAKQVVDDLLAVARQMLTQHALPQTS